MKVNIHDINPDLLSSAINEGVLEGCFNGTLSDGSPACATIKPVTWRIAGEHPSGTERNS
jgi:hypothetical protein